MNQRPFCGQCPLTVARPYPFFLIPHRQNGEDEILQFSKKKRRFPCIEKYKETVFLFCKRSFTELSFQKADRSSYKMPNRAGEMPKSRIQSEFQPIHGGLFAVFDDSCYNSDQLVVPHMQFGIKLIIPHHGILSAHCIHCDDSMKYILPIVAPIQRHIVLFQPMRQSLQNHLIEPAADGGQHAFSPRREYNGISARYLLSYHGNHTVKLNKFLTQENRAPSRY